MLIDLVRDAARNLAAAEPGSFSVSYTGKNKEYIVVRWGSQGFLVSKGKETCHLSFDIPIPFEGNKREILVFETVEDTEEAISTLTVKNNAGKTTHRPRAVEGILLTAVEALYHVITNVISTDTVFRP